MQPSTLRPEHRAPLVSVVIATYNRWPLVRETIESVLTQSFDDHELVMVDDGSPDRTADHIEGEFPSVRVFRQENAERGAAFNRGISEARGEFVAFLGDDDIYEPWHLAQFANARRALPEGKAFASRAWLWDPSTGRRTLLPGFDPETLARDALIRTQISPQALIVARSELLAVGGFPEDRAVIGSEDWVLLLKLSRRLRIEPLPRPSVRIRQHAGRTMSNLRMISRSREVATEQVLDGTLLKGEFDDDARRLLVAGAHRLAAAHFYGAGEMRAARTRIRDVRRTLGWIEGTRWTGRLWLQTWLGASASSSLRRLRERAAAVGTNQETGRR